MINELYNKLFYINNEVYTVIEVNEETTSYGTNAGRYGNEPIERVYRVTVSRQHGSNTTIETEDINFLRTLFNEGNALLTSKNHGKVTFEKPLNTVGILEAQAKLFGDVLSTARGEWAQRKISSKLVMWNGLPLTVEIWDKFFKGNAVIEGDTVIKDRRTIEDLVKHPRRPYEKPKTYIEELATIRDTEFSKVFAESIESLDSTIKAAARSGFDNLTIDLSELTVLEGCFYKDPRFKEALEEQFPGCRVEYDNRKSKLTILDTELTVSSNDLVIIKWG